MQSRLIYNGALTNAAKAHVPAFTKATFYGTGVFTNVAIYKAHPFLWERHWERLVDNAARLKFSCSGVDHEAITSDLRRLIEANRVVRGRARVALLSRENPDRWDANASSENGPDVLIATGDEPVTPENGIALTVSPFRTSSLSPLAGVKSLNYLHQSLSWEEARSRGFDEAVALNERGEIVGATRANIFWVSENTLHTPALDSGSVAGITRGCVLELAAKMSIPTVEAVYDFTRLSEADEIFLTSATLGVALVTTFDFRNYTIPVGSFALRLREAFRQLTIEDSGDS